MDDYSKVLITSIDSGLREIVFKSRVKKILELTKEFLENYEKVLSLMNGLIYDINVTKITKIYEYFQKQKEEIDKYERDFCSELDERISVSATVLIDVLLLLFKKDKEYINKLNNIAKTHPNVKRMAELVEKYYKDLVIDVDPTMLEDLENKTVSLDYLNELLAILRKKSSMVNGSKELIKELEKYLYNINEEKIILELIVKKLRECGVLDQNYSLDESKTIEGLIERIEKKSNGLIFRKKSNEVKGQVFATLMLLRVLKNPEQISGLVEGLEIIKS